MHQPKPKVESQTLLSEHESDDFQNRGDVCAYESGDYNLYNEFVEFYMFYMSGYEVLSNLNLTWSILRNLEHL